MVMTTSDAAATSRGVPTTLAPAASNSAAFSGLDVVTVTSWPALSRLFAMGLPMMPSPMNPILTMNPSSRGVPHRLVDAVAMSSTA